MMHRPEARLHGSHEHGAADLISRSLHDCLLVEAMPPIWTWAYSKLLTIGETRPEFRARVG